MLILAETQITYINDEDLSKLTQPLEEATAFKTWERIDNQRYVLGDIYGKLYLLSEAGDLVTIRLGEKPEVVAESKTGERGQATPAIAAGAVFFRTDKGLYAVGK